MQVCGKFDFAGLALIKRCSSSGRMTKQLFPDLFPGNACGWIIRLSLDATMQLRFLRLRKLHRFRRVRRNAIPNIFDKLNALRYRYAFMSSIVIFMNNSIFRFCSVGFSFLIIPTKFRFMRYAQNPP
jgi:hypothetical protein